MSQLNINLSGEFEEALERLMRLRRIRTKSDAIRLAIQESLERALAETRDYDFTGLVGRARDFDATGDEPAQPWTRS